MYLASSDESSCPLRQGGASSELKLLDFEMYVFNKGSQVGRSDMYGASAEVVVSDTSAADGGSVLEGGCEVVVLDDAVDGRGGGAEH